MALRLLLTGSQEILPNSPEIKSLPCAPSAIWGYFFYEAEIELAVDGDKYEVSPIIDVGITKPFYMRLSALPWTDYETIVSKILESPEVIHAVFSGYDVLPLEWRLDHYTMQGLNKLLVFGRVLYSLESAANETTSFDRRLLEGEPFNQQQWALVPKDAPIYSGEWHFDDILCN